MLEESGLPHRVIPVNLAAGEQNTPEYRAINPNGKIPALVDPEGPDGEKIVAFESGAILVYLGEKTGSSCREIHGVASRCCSGRCFR